MSRGVTYLRDMASIFVVVAMSVLSSCKKEEAETFTITDRSSLPSQYAENVNTLISDSGVVKYHMTAEKWYIYDKVDTPYWDFPLGLVFETYDNNMNVEASICSKWGKYLTDLEFWELRDSVRAKNTEGEYFETEHLFWNQKTEMVYSDEKIRIIQKERIIIGKGFESNQSFTKYEIKNVEGLFPIND